MKKIISCICAVMMIAVLCTSCNAGVTEPIADMTPQMTWNDWNELSGTPVELAVSESEVTEPTELLGGDYPYFYATVLEATQEYIVVKPLVNNDENADGCSWSEKLLQKSETYLIPRVTAPGGVISAETVAPGNTVRIDFNNLSVVENTSYGQSPVIRVVFGVRASENG